MNYIKTDIIKKVNKIKSRLRQVIYEILSDGNWL